MKKITVIFITFAIALSSCATRRSTSQRVDNLPPVYVSLKNILADSRVYSRPIAVIDGLPISPWEVVEMKIDINTIIWAVVFEWHTEVIIGGGDVLFIATGNYSPTSQQRRRRERSESSLRYAQISLNSLLADNGLCENCPVVIDGVIVSDLGTSVEINAITAVMIASDELLRSGGIERDCILIIRTR